MKCLNCKNETPDGDKYCCTDCYIKKAGFTYEPPEQPRFIVIDKYPCPLIDNGQGPTKWVYDTKDQSFVRKAIVV